MASSGKTGQQVGISVGAARAMLERVVERGEKLELPLNARVVVPHYAMLSVALRSEKMRNFISQRSKPIVISRAGSCPAVDAICEGISMLGYW